MNVNNVVRTIRIRGESEGLDKLAGDLNKVAGAQQNVAGMSAKSGKSMEDIAVVSERTSKGVLSLEDAWKKQTLKLDEAARAQANIGRETRLADAVLREGLITQQQHAERLNMISQRYAVAGAATQKFAGQTGLARHELVNLGRQAQDVGVSLASGQSPFMVLIQQGTQIADVFATSGGTLRGFFSQAAGWAGTFLTSTAGIVTSVLAIGGAAIFAASQFVRAQTTIEQALEEQNRLLKEGKALLDARTSAEARAQLQSRGQTQFETLRNQLDLQNKLNKAMEDAAKVAGGRSTTPTGGGMPEMGIAPSGVAPSKDPGLAAMASAVDTLMSAIAKGEPGLKQFNSELGRIGLAHPELALVVQDMIKAGEAGLQLEFAAQRAKAMSDALAGVATNAQLAAVGLGSIAQFKLNNLMADEAKESTERQAVAILRLRENWGGVSVEAAKTLDSLSRQLDVAQAVGAMAQIEVQHKAKIAELSQRMSESEARRIADYERAVSLAQIEAQHKQTMVALQGQLSVAEQVTGIGQINAQYEATVASLSLQIGQVKAIEQAEMQRAISIAQVNANADQTLNSLRQQNELIRAGSDEEEDRIRAQQTYQNLIAQGVDKSKAAAVASQQQSNAEEAREKRHQAAAEKAIANIKTTEDAWKAYNTTFENTERRLISWNQANEEAGKIMRRQEAAAEDAAWAWNKLAGSMFNAANAATIAYNAFIPFSVTEAGSAPGILAPTGDVANKSGGRTQFNPEGYKSTVGSAATLTSLAGAGYTDPWSQYSATLAGGLTKSQGPGLSSSFGGGSAIDTEKLATLERLIAVMPQDQQATATRSLIDELNQRTPSLERDEAIQKLTQSLDQLRDATNANTQAITDVLSPLYTSDPRKTHLGFRAFSGGGIMSPWGEIPINRYAGGGIADSPQVSVFGEGSTPEAYVPVPSGRIPVEIRQPANSNQKQDRPITVSIIVQGNATPETVDALKRTAFQQAQAMRRALG